MWRHSDVSGEPRSMPLARSILWKPIPDSYHLLATLIRGAEGEYALFVTQRTLLGVERHAAGPTGAAGAQRLGLLLGGVHEDAETGERFVVVDGFAPLPDIPEDDEDPAAAAAAVERVVQRALRRRAALAGGAPVVGWYRGCPTLGLRLSPADVAIHLRYFAEPWQAALLLAPGDAETRSAGAFFMFEGRVARSYCVPFYELIDPFPNRLLGKSGTCVTWQNYFSDDGAPLLTESEREAIASQPTAEGAKPGKRSASGSRGLGLGSLIAGVGRWLRGSRPDADAGEAAQVVEPAQPAHAAHGPAVPQAADERAAVVPPSDAARSGAGPADGAAADAPQDDLAPRPAAGPSRARDVPGAPKAPHLGADGARADAAREAPREDAPRAEALPAPHAAQRIFDDDPALPPPDLSDPNLVILPTGFFAKEHTAPRSRRGLYAALGVAFILAGIASAAWGYRDSRDDDTTGAAAPPPTGAQALAAAPAAPTRRVTGPGGIVDRRLDSLAQAITYYREVQADFERNRVGCRVLSQAHRLARQHQAAAQRTVTDSLRPFEQERAARHAALTAEMAAIDSTFALAGCE